MNKQEKRMIWIAAAMIICAALLRLVLYPHNFSPVIAMALFSGAVVKDKKLAFALPLFSMFLSDVGFQVFNIATGFWGWGQLIGYAIIAALTIFGFSLKKINAIKLLGFSISSSLIFFFLSNSTVWIFSKGYYAASFSGWMDCLTAGVPFLKTGLVADLFYSVVLFGSYVLLQQNSNRRVVANS